MTTGIQEAVAKCTSIDRFKVGGKADGAIMNETAGLRARREVGRKPSPRYAG